MSEVKLGCIESDVLGILLMSVVELKKYEILTDDVRQLCFHVLTQTESFFEKCKGKINKAR
jgi:DNA-binding ferritin-like protein (Dps family)